MFRVVEYPTSKKYKLLFGANIRNLMNINHKSYKMFTKKIKNTGYSLIRGDKENVLSQFNFLNEFILNKNCYIDKEH